MEIYEDKVFKTYGEIDIKCPKCQSNKVLTSLDEKGYFFVSECKDCGYKS